MKNLYFFLLMLLALISAKAQSCLPEGITFSTQAQIDNFQLNFPSCSEIEGTVTISGSDITNLNGLTVVTSIGGGLYIYFNDILTSLTGLGNVISIGENLLISSNNVLASLMGLANLTSIEGNIEIWGDNPALTNLKGLEHITSIGGYLGVWANSAFSSFEGLENLTSIGGSLFIESNNGLTSLTELNNVTFIGGSLNINYNNALTNLTGLDNINAGSIDNLMISENHSLSTCEVQSVCDYLASPNGTIEINDNATGCNNQLEVQARCGSPIAVPISNWALVLGGAIIALGTFFRYRRIV